MATIGSVIGGYLTYKLGHKGGEEALEQRLSKRKRDRVKRIFEKFGFGAVFLPAIMPPPVPISPFLLSAGAMDYPKKKFLLALTAGRSLRFTLVAYFASIYGRQVLRLFADNYMTVIIIAVSLAVIGVLVFLVYRARRKKTNEQAPSPSVS
jgi:membrane protein DedA with SNARE-associated domain